VAVEAVVARRVIGGGWGPALKVSVLANLATTITGVSGDLVPDARRPARRLAESERVRLGVELGQGVVGR
jgi:hypothetical protein